MATIQEATLSVPDVSCGHCVQTINSTLSALTGVEAVSTDIATKSVNLRYDSNVVSMEQIETALDDVGYTVAKEPRLMPRRTGKPLRLA
jgi:copper ion binding protein